MASIDVTEMSDLTTATFRGELIVDVYPDVNTPAIEDGKGGIWIALTGKLEGFREGSLKEVIVILSSGKFVASRISPFDLQSLPSIQKCAEITQDNEFMFRGKGKSDDKQNHLLKVGDKKVGEQQEWLLVVATTRRHRKFFVTRRFQWVVRSATSCGDTKDNAF